MHWTEVEIELLQSLYGNGMSAANITKQMNRTRNAIIGKANSLGLSAKTETEPKPREIMHKKNPHAPIVRTTSRALMDVGNRDCRYTEDGLSYCCKPITRKSYCTEHYNICHVSKIHVC